MALSPQYCFLLISYKMCFRGFSGKFALGIKLKWGHAIVAVILTQYHFLFLFSRPGSL